jgi:hypothetical protein
LTPSPVYGSEMKTTPWQFEGRIIENWWKVDAQKKQHSNKVTCNGNDVVHALQMCYDILWKRLQWTSIQNMK